MNYDNFKEQFCSKVKAALEAEGYAVLEKVVLKTNGRHLDSLIVSPPDSKVSPTIYVEPYYDGYLAGGTLEEAVNYAVRTIMVHCRTELKIPELNRQTAMENLYAIVVNADLNKEMLSECPHRLLAEDLAIVPRFRVDVPDGSGSFLVKHEMLPRLQMTKDEVINVALNNSKQQQFELKSMSDMLRDMFTGAEEPIPDEMLEEMFPNEDIGMYVLTNTEKVNGAVVLACKDLLSNAMEQIGDCFILPSSLHEVILVKKSMGHALEELEAMVKEVNRTQVAPEEILSNHVYEINPLTKKLQIAKGKEIVEKTDLQKRMTLCM